jgi:hypothetical protein
MYRQVCTVYSGEKKTMERLVHYIAGFVPEFPSRIRGTTEEELEELEELIKRPLPKIYREFLLRMGHDHGGLALLGMAKTEYGAILKRYERAFVRDLPLPANALLIGDHVSVDLDLVLADQPEGEPRVMLAEDADIVGFVARSLEVFLFQRAFTQYALRALPHRADWASPLRVAESEVGRVTSDLGFMRLWFSDTGCYCGETPEARVVVSTPDRGSTLVQLGCSDAAILESLGRRFEAELGVKRDQVRYAAAAR